jgi:TolB protein
MPTLPTFDPSRITLPSHIRSALFPYTRRLLPIRLFREIAFFGYTLTGYDGDTESQEDIFAVSPLTGAVRRIVDDRGAAYKSDRDPAWSPNRRTLAIHSATVAHPESRLRIVSASTGAVTRELVDGYSPEWVDARTLLFLRSAPAGRPNVHALDIPTLDVQRITDLGPDAEVTGMSWHRTAGLALSYATLAPGTSWDVAVVPVATVAAARAPGGAPVGLGALTPLTPGRAVSAPSWDRAASRIALTTWNPGSPSRVGYLDVARGVFTRLPPPPTRPGGPQLGDAGAIFSPDGGMIAFTRGAEDEWTEIWLHTLSTGRRRRLTNDHENRFKGALDW